MSESQRRSILDAASKDADLLREVPPVVAAGFGVLPLRRLGDVLTVACFAGANRSALRLLRDVLGLEIVATPFEDRLLRRAIHRAYFPGDESVNFPTFTEREFLEDPESAPRLREQKLEDPGPVRRELPSDRIALGTLTYRARLDDLDLPRRGGALPEPRRTRLELGDLELAWRRSQGGPRVRREEPGDLPEGALCVLNEYRLSDSRHLPDGGRLSEHDIRATLLEELPHVIHPTEVQLTGVTGDGELVLHVYDRREVLAPGDAPRTLCVTYYFLSYGHRLRREIEVTLHELEVQPRRAVEAGPLGAPWSGTELARWLGVAG